ncbi:MAG: methylglyoxal synthase [Sporolactobacillus sp.]
MKIALIAHDAKKKEMVNFAMAYKNVLKAHQLYATGTTGLKVQQATGLAVHRFQSGPLGGDQQIGAMIASNALDMVVFLRDPLTVQPHEPDVNALLRLSDVYRIPLATNLASADILMFALSKGELHWRELIHERHAAHDK